MKIRVFYEVEDKLYNSLVDERLYLNGGFQILNNKNIDDFPAGAFTMDKAYSIKPLSFLGSLGLMYFAGTDVFHVGKAIGLFLYYEERKKLISKSIMKQKIYVDSQMNNPYKT